MESEENSLLYPQNKSFLEGNRQSIHNYDEFVENFSNSHFTSMYYNLAFGAILIIPPLMILYAIGKFLQDLFTEQSFGIFGLAGATILILGLPIFSISAYKTLTIVRVAFSKNPIQGLLNHIQLKGTVTVGKIYNIEQLEDKSRIYYAYEEDDGSRKFGQFITNIKTKFVGEPVTVVYTPFISFLL